jgi:AraC family transcriptional regulator
MDAQTIVTSITDHTRSEDWIFRIGSVAGIVGSFPAMVGNLDRDHHLPHDHHAVGGAEAMRWSKIGEWNEPLGMYPDMDLLRHVAQTMNARRIELEMVVHRPDPILLGIAHVFQRTCAAEHTICDIQASSLAHLLARRLLVTYCGVELPDAKLPGSKMSETAIRTVCDFIEEHLSTQITLEDLAALVHLSPFHFARCFKASTGLAPHQYLIARRMELAKRLVLTTTLTVSQIGWSIGYENISHFRRLFALHIGVTPGAIRRAVGIQQRA